jgi:hypothetical protein
VHFGIDLGGTLDQRFCKKDGRDTPVLACKISCICLVPLPQEVEDEIRGLDHARRRVAELEREIKRLKGATAAPQFDNRVIERAVRSAVEQERVGWRRNWSRAGRIFAK